MATPAVSKYKHNSSKSQGRRKPQKTALFENAKGDRYRVPLDLGWGDPYWNAIKRRVLIDCALAQNPPEYVHLEVATDRVEAFERFCNRKKVDYLEIKAKQNNCVGSHFFAHDVKPQVMNKLGKYSKTTPTLKDDALKAEFNRLLDWKLQPDKKGARRYKCTPLLRHGLHVAWVKQMWKDVSSDPKELAHRIKADITLHIGRLPPVDMGKLLDDAGLNTKESAEVIKEMKKDKWYREVTYKGLPEHGAIIDEKALRGGMPVFKVSKPDSKAGIFSKRLQEADSWETTPTTEGPQKDVHL
jgi:hypothetical protein